MSQVILEIFEDNIFPIETAICLSVIEYATSSLPIHFIKAEGKERSYQIKYELLEETRQNIFKCVTIPKHAIHTTLPAIVMDGNLSYIAGLAAVLRQIIKCSQTPYLLGFRNCCLVAPAEVSCWTRFCEVDLIKCVKRIMLNPPDQYHSENKKCFIEDPSSKTVLEKNNRNIADKDFCYSYLPEELGTLEYHLSIPAKVHNKGKYGDEGPNHDYVEGPSMVLSDLIIAFCVHIILDYLNAFKIETLPFTLKWLNRVKEERSFSKCLDRVSSIYNEKYKCSPTVWLMPIFNNGPIDLYKKEGTRRKKIFTQGDLLSTSLDVISEVKLMEYSQVPNITELELKSMKVALPDVPRNRLERKTQQLSNLAKATLLVAKEGDIIVDFCSGSGHLGILLATLMPFCTVILLDNKENSLERAKSRVKEMQLSNVKIIQSNLDYFTRKFQVGVSLHACGVASDLIINKCVNSKAHMILCPCCYGGIQSNHLVHYPQSTIFKDTGLSEKDFFVLAHNADTCDTESGHIAMTAVDSDRCFYLSQLGYSISLSKLQPLECTTRNNLIVAVNSL